MELLTVVSSSLRDLRSAKGSIGSTVSIRTIANT